MVGGALEGAYQGSYKLAPVGYRISVICKTVFDELEVAQSNDISMHQAARREAISYYCKR